MYLLRTILSIWLWNLLRFELGRSEGLSVKNGYMVFSSVCHDGVEKQIGGSVQLQIKTTKLTNRWDQRDTYLFKGNFQSNYAYYRTKKGEIF